MTLFSDLGLAQPLLKALAAEGYTNPTPIQEQAIPTLLQGRDLLGIAQTGTGKTAAFALPILHRLAENRRPAPRNGCRVLVLAPTRELATQIAESFKTYGKGMGFTVAVIFGGAKYGPQIKALQGGLDVLVATPGRLIDHIAEKHARLGETEVFVLDEADQMLDLGFLQPIRRIVSHLPKVRHNLFFSATMPNEIGKLAGDLLKDPAKVSITPESTTVDRVDQRLIFVEQDRKRELLAELLADPAMKRTIIFTKTKRGADKVAKGLEAAGITSAAIHGDKSQGQRERALAAFKSGACRTLVATDIAARGIDIDAVTHVVNFELPYVPEAYVHRIGRTARAGATGHAISLCCDDERPLLKDIQRTTRQTIPAEDRRRDKTLGLMTAARQQEEAANAPKGGRGGERGGQGRGQKQGRDRSHAAPGGGNPAAKNRRRKRPAAGGQAAHGGGQAGKTAAGGSKSVWSNWTPDVR